MKIKHLILFTIFIFFINCKKEDKKPEFEKFAVKNNIIPDSISKKLTEFKINNDIISKQSINIGFNRFPALHQNYICKAQIEKNDTLNIWINNYNGYFGNGILINVFQNNFEIKSIDPNVIRGTKFEKFDPLKQELTLNKSNFKSGDSIFGKLYFECIVDSAKHKKMYGYFKTKIK